MTQYFHGLEGSFSFGVWEGVSVYEVMGQHDDKGNWAKSTIVERGPVSSARQGLRLAAALGLVYILPAAVVLLLHVLAAVDPPYQKVPQAPGAARTDFYDESYDSASPDTYVAEARKAAERYDIKGGVTRFVDRYGLRQKRVLEVGAGSGLLQDVVSDYTALDIAPSAARFFHKPFVAGSATDMPFRDSEFDVIWTIWVLEHVDKPEWALQEMRRVVKNGGILFLAPAWNCTPWAAQGYEVRPYSDLDLAGKMIKASIPLRRDIVFQWLSRVPMRSLRFVLWRATRTPTRLRYKKLEPNYKTYWMPDADAVNSIDSFDAYLWFASRGDECLNCSAATDELRGYERWPLIIRVRKQ